jgi:hypothetical protein
VRNGEPEAEESGSPVGAEAYRLPECRAMGVSRSTVRYESLRPSKEPLRARLRESAAVRVS